MSTTMGLTCLFYYRFLSYMQPRLNSLTFYFQAFITALDKTPQKVAKIITNCQLQGLTCVNSFAYDSTKCHSEESSGINSGPPFPSNCFDKVLLDAPCSGLGQRPQLCNKMTPTMIQSYKFLQRKLFTAVSKDVISLALIHSTALKEVHI